MNLKEGSCSQDITEELNSFNKRTRIDDNNDLKCNTSILSLPVDILRSIFRVIEPEDWPSVSLTCKEFYDYGINSFDHTLNDNNVLRYACWNGNYELVKKLLLSNNTVNPNTYWETYVKLLFF